MSDSELAQLIRQGQKSTAEGLYDTYARFLLLAIIRIVPERKMAESVLQVTFSIIWNSIDDYAIEKGRVYTWMVAIARKTAFETTNSTKNYDTKKGGIYAGKR